MINSIYDMLILRSRVSPIPPQPDVPTDYVFYAPLTNNILDVSTYARTINVLAGNPTFTMQDSIVCTEIPANSGLYTTDNTDLPSGDSSWTLSLWMKISSVFPSTSESVYPIIMSLGYAGGKNQCIAIGVHNGQYYASSWNAYALYSGVSQDTVWHNHIFIHDETTGANTYYIDGVSVGSNTNALALTTAINIGASCSYGQSGKTNPFPVTTYVTAYRVYNRALDSNEINVLANEDLSQEF